MRQARKWVVQPPAPAAFLNSIPEPPLLAQVLYNRGIRTPAEAKTFLEGHDARLDNPFRLKDMEPAVARLLRAIQKQEVICVYGDFDADGVTATALMVTAFQALGAKVGSYIPDRVDEGYGLNVEAVERIAQQAKVMVTVDCGIRSVTEVRRANELGMDVIITDHHSVGPELPPALAVINPQRADDTSRFHRLAGVGVAYRLVQALLRTACEGKGARLTPDEAHELEGALLDYVALGTVADMMPLLEENRSLVQQGLALLNLQPRVGVQQLMGVSGLRGGGVNAEAISFRLAPRLNAAGRLAHAKLAYRLLRTNDPTEAFTLAAELEALNQKRRKLTDSAAAEAEEQLARQAEGGAHLYVVRSRSFQPGIVGLVAGKLADRLYRPAVVIEEGEHESRGSARSIAELDISRALDEVAGYLVRHGGHSRAAGFTIQTARLGEFCEALQSVAARELAAHTDLRPSLLVDAEAPFDSLTWGLLEQLQRLEPTGQDNATPLLMSHGLHVRDVRSLSDGKHLKLIVDAGDRGFVLDAIAFGQGEWAGHLRQGDRVDMVYQLNANHWNGRRILQLQVQDLRKAEKA